MQLLSSADLSKNAQYDVYIDRVKPKVCGETNQQILKIVLISCQSLSSMQVESYRTTLPDRAYSRSLHAQVTFSTTFTKFVSGMKKIRNIITTSYAKLKIKDGLSTLTISPFYTKYFEQGLPVRIVHYGDRMREDRVDLGPTQIFAFTEEEFPYKYIRASHRIQTILQSTIFEQPKKKTSFFRGLWDSIGEDKNSDKDYEPGIPYIIEGKLRPHKIKEQRKFLGTSIGPGEDVDSETSFSSAQESGSSDEEFVSPSSSPEPKSSLASYPSQKTTTSRNKKDISTFQDLVNEISQILSINKLNLDSNFSEDGSPKFTISLQFKRSPIDPEAILLTTWLNQKPNGSSALCYATPMKVRIDMNGSYEEFEYVDKVFVPVPLSDDTRWASTDLAHIAPKKRGDLRKCAMFETYLQALELRYLIKSRMHEGGELARRKFETAYSTNKWLTDFSPHIAQHDYSEKLIYRHKNFKARTVECIGIGDSQYDSTPLILDFRKKFYKMYEGKLVRIKGNPDLQKATWGKKEKIYTGVDKNKAVKLEVDNPMFSSDYEK